MSRYRLDGSTETELPAYTGGSGTAGDRGNLIKKSSTKGVSIEDVNTLLCGTNYDLGTINTSYKQGVVAILLDNDLIKYLPRNYTIGTYVYDDQSLTIKYAQQNPTDYYTISSINSNNIRNLISITSISDTTHYQKYLEYKIEGGTTLYKIPACYVIDQVNKWSEYKPSSNNELYDSGKNPIDLVDNNTRENAFVENFKQGLIIIGFSETSGTTYFGEIFKYMKGNNNSLPIDFKSLNLNRGFFPKLPTDVYRLTDWHCYYHDAVFPLSINGSANISITAESSTIAESNADRYPALFTIPFIYNKSYNIDLKKIRPLYHYNQTTQPIIYSDNENCKLCILVTSPNATNWVTNSQFFYFNIGSGEFSATINFDPDQSSIPVSKSMYTSTGQCNLSFDWYAFLAIESQKIIIPIPTSITTMYGKYTYSRTVKGVSFSFGTFGFYNYTAHTKSFYKLNFSDNTSGGYTGSLSANKSFYGTDGCYRGHLQAQVNGKAYVIDESWSHETVDYTTTQDFINVNYKQGLYAPCVIYNSSSRYNREVNIYFAYGYYYNGEYYIDNDRRAQIRVSMPPSSRIFGGFTWDTSTLTLTSYVQTSATYERISYNVFNGIPNVDSHNSNDIDLFNTQTLSSSVYYPVLYVGRIQITNDNFATSNDITRIVMSYFRNEVTSKTVTVI